MSLALLDRIKQKALDALNGVEQGVGNFVQNFEHPQPIQNPQSVGINPSSQPFDLGGLLKTVADTVAKQPLIQSPVQDPNKPAMGPTVGDAAGFLRDTAQGVARSVPGLELTVAHKLDPNNFPTERNTSDVADPNIRAISETLFGKNQTVRTIGATQKLLEKYGVPSSLALAGAVADPISNLTGVEGLVKGGVEKGGEQVVKQVAKDVAEQGTKTGGEDLLKQGVKKTAELFGESGSKSNPFQAGDVFKPKGTIKKTWEDLARSSKGVIGRAGDAGKEIVARLSNAESDAASLAGNAKAQLEGALKALNPDEVRTFSDVAEGKIAPVSDIQAQAVKIWNNIAQDVQTKAKGAGIDMGALENYFPHYTKKLTNADKTVIAQEMVQSGKYATEAEARQALEQESKGALGRQSERRFGNLELSRDSNLPYHKDPNVLFDYIDNAYGRIADATHFGKDDSQLYKLAQAAGTQGGDSNQIAKYLDQILGKNQSSNKIAQRLTSLQTISKLNPVTSAINLTQNLSTWLRTDTGTMAKTMKDIIANPGEAFANATKVGEIGPNIKSFEDYTGGGNAASKWIRLIGMQGTEKFNRVVAVNAGINYGKKLASQAAEGSGAAIRELQRFGIGLDEIKNGVLSDSALKKIGREVSSATQFSTKPGELPYFWRTGAGKVITQFKSFAYKQTGFVKNEVGRVGSEAAAGNVKPLINALVVYGVAAPLAGEIVNDFKSLIRNNKRQDTGSLTQRYISNILAATSFGLLDSTSGLLGEYGPAGVVSTIGGPTVSDVQKIIQAGGDAVSGLSNGDGVDPFNRTKRALLKEIPAVGPTIANTVVPNSFVDNYVGVNNGTDSSGNPPTPTENIFQKAGDFLTGSSGKQSGDVITWKDDSGKKVTVDLKQKDYSSKGGIAGYKQDTSNASKAVQIFGASDSQVSSAQKEQAFAKLGYKRDDVEYAYKAGFTADEKTAYIEDQNLDHKTLMDRLTTGRVESIKGDYFAANGVIDNLYNDGLLSKQEAAALKKIKISKDGKLATSSLAALSGTGMTAAQLRAKVNSVNSLFKNTITTQKTNKPTKVKEPKKPKINFGTPKSTKKTANQWYTPYA